MRWARLGIFNMQKQKQLTTGVVKSDPHQNKMIRISTNIGKFYNSTNKEVVTNEGFVIPSRAIVIFAYNSDHTYIFMFNPYDHSFRECGCFETDKEAKSWLSNDFVAKNLITLPPYWFNNLNFKALLRGFGYVMKSLK